MEGTRGKEGRNEKEGGLDRGKKGGEKEGGRQEEKGRAGREGGTLGGWGGVHPNVKKV